MGFANVVFVGGVTEPALRNELVRVSNGEW